MSKINLSASLRARLLNLARETKQDFNLVLTRYSLERLLYRISVSPHADKFLLKGALLFDLWFDISHRPTRDADFLGYGPSEPLELQDVFKEICIVESEDGIQFQANTVKATEIRKDANYAGVRITLLGILDGARCHLQVDVGFGDAVTPEPESVEYPTLIAGLDSPKLRAYPKYTVIAEKFQALTSLGIANSRMKDYFDLWTLSQHSGFNGKILQSAIFATFERRGTPLRKETPFGLTDEFTTDTQKQTQWKAFIRKNNLQAPSLTEVANVIRDFLMPPVISAATDSSFTSDWDAGGPWKKQ